MIRKWLLAAAAILGLAPSPPAYSDTVVSGGRVVFGNDFFVNPAGPQGPTVHFKRPGNAQAWTTGSVIYASNPNELGEDNATFFWDKANKRLGLGMNVPGHRLQVHGASMVFAPAAGGNPGFSMRANGAFWELMGIDPSWSVAWNDVGISVGGGTPAIYAKASNNFVGINISNPVFQLDVNGQIHASSQGSMFGWASGNMNAATAANTNILLYNAGPTNWSGIGAHTGGEMYFVTGTAAPTTRMVLNTNGYLGIGITVPSQKLHVEGGIILSSNGYFITTGTLATYNFYDRDLGGGNSQIYRQSGISIFWDNVAGNVMSYTNAGSVGINTTAPLGALDIRAPGADTYVYVGAGRTGSNGIWVGKARTSGNGFAYLDLVGDMTYTDYGLRVIRNQTGSDTTSQILHRGLGDLQFYTVDPAPISFVTYSTGRMWISAAGNVGIGTSAPRQKLEIYGPSATIAFVDTTSTATNKVWDLIASASTFQGRLIDDTYATGSNWIWVGRSANTVSKVIFPDGAVGIGIWTPGARLHVSNPDTYTNLVVSGYTKGVRLGNFADRSIVEGVDASGGASYQPLYIGGSTVTMGASSGGAIYINANNTVGIHTTANRARLDFGGAMGDNIIYLFDDGTNFYGWGIRGGQKMDYASDNSRLTWGHMSSAGVYTERTSIDQYGNFIVNNGQFYSGYSQLNNEALELCINRPGDGYCYVDLHSQPGTDFNFRMFRAGGVDGSADFTQNGLGAINFYQYGGRLPLRIQSGRVIIDTDLGPALSVSDAGGMDLGNYGTVNITRGATDGSRAHLAFIRNGNAVMQFGYFPSSNDFGIWPGGYPGETAVRISSGGMTLGVAPIVSNKGGLSIGDGNRNWNPNDGTTGWGATLLMTGLDVTSIGFHDGSCCLGWIRYTANNFTIGFDYGWGVATTYFGGWVTTYGGLTAIGSLVSYNGMDFYDRTNTATGYSALFRSGGVSRLWNNTSGDVIAYGANGNVAMGNLQFGVSKLYVKSGDTDNILYASGDSAAVRLGASGGWGKVGATDTVASVWLPLIISGSHVLFGIQGVENARVDSNGNFGIGYSAPGHKLEVNGNGYFNSTLESVNTLYSYNELRVTNAAFIGANGLYVNGYRTVYADASWVQIMDTVGRGGFYLGNGTTYMRNYQLYFDDHGGTNFADVNSGGWKFNIDAKLANNRRVGSFDTTGNYRNLIMLGSDNTMYVGDASFGFTQFNAGSTIHVSTTIMRVYAGSQFEVMNYNAYKNGGGSWLDNSDIRTKKEVFDYRVGLSEISRIRPVVYKHNGKYGTEDNDERYVGFVADEVRKHMPEMVGFRYAKETPDSTEYTKILTIDMTALPLALVNAVQELEARIKALETPGGRPTPQ